MGGSASIEEKLKAVKGDNENIIKQLEDIKKDTAEQREKAKHKADKDKLTTIHGALTKTIVSIQKVKSHDPVEKAEGVLGLVGTVIDLATDSPIGSILAAVCSIFLDIFTTSKGGKDELAAIGEVFRKELLQFRDENQKAHFQGLCDTMRVNFNTKYLKRHVTHDEKKLPESLMDGIFGEMVTLAGEVAARFAPTSDKKALGKRLLKEGPDQADIPKAVDTYCYLSMQYLTYMTMLLSYCVVAERTSDVEDLCDRLDAYKELMNEYLGFWSHLWHDFQHDQGKKFFVSHTHKQRSGAQVSGNPKRGLSVPRVSIQGCWIPIEKEEPLHLHQEYMHLVTTDSYISDYDFSHVDCEYDLPVLICLYYRQNNDKIDPNIDHRTVPKDPVALRILCKEYLGVQSKSCDDLTNDEKSGIEGILQYKGFVKTPRGPCVIL